MKKIVNVIIVVIIGFNTHAQYAPPLMYFYSGDQQIFLMNDSSSANIIIRNTENYNLIVDNVLTLFDSENDTIWFDDDDDNIIIKSNKLKQITSDSIIHFIQVDTNDIMFFTYSKIKNLTSQVWLRNDLIVVLKDNYDTSDISSIYSNFNIFEIIRDDSNEYVIRCKSEYDIFQLSNLLYNSGFVKYSEPDFYGTSKLTSIDDPLFNYQFYLKNMGQYISDVIGGGNYGTKGIDINVLNAWLMTKGSSTIKVAVIDEGVENHEDLYDANGNTRVLEGFTPLCISNCDGRPRSSLRGHGLCCAGIISASHNNLGIAGIAPNIKIIPICIFKKNGKVYSNRNVKKAIKKAWDDLDADILSISCQLDGTQLLWDEIISASQNGRNSRGCIIVASSGNSASDVVAPANLKDNVISVGAINLNGIRFNYSCYGGALDLVAPSGQLTLEEAPYTLRGNIRTIDRLGSNGFDAGNYTHGFGGTSASCPQVSGIAALMLSVNPNLTKNQVMSILNQTATKLSNYAFTTNYNHPDGTWNNEVGYGLVNAHKAVVYAFMYGHEMSISGQNNIDICNTSTYTYTCNIYRPDLFTYQWICSSNLLIVEQNNYTVHITPVAEGSGIVTVNVYSQGELMYTIHKNLTITNSFSNLIPISTSPLYITSNTTWNSTSNLLSTPTTVESGAILTVTGQVYCTKYTLITILPGGKLILDGGTLTNACDGELWQGIFVEGDPSDATQSENNQGVVELKNGATIENAVCAINVGFERLGPSPEGCVLGGGIVRASNASFINNLQAVEFGPYHRHKMVGSVPLTRNASNFSFCHFTVNDNALFDLNEFEEHVNLVEVNEIGFHSCNFSSTKNIGTAIKTLIAGSFILDNLGDIFNPVRSSVNGFDNAIRIKDGKSTTILNTDFNENNTAVLVEGADNLTIGGNGFYIPYESYYGPTTGVSLTNTPQFKINNNLFQGVYNCNYGLIINHSGENDNVVKNNEFSSLRIAALAYGKNSDGEDGYKGLQYQCNKFGNNDYDIVVSDFVTEYYMEPGSIRFNQGDKDKACGNIFTVNGNSLTSPNYDFQYHFTSNSPDQIPFNIIDNIWTVAEYNHLCNQIGVENPNIAPDNPPINWNDELVNDYEIVAASLETSKSIYFDNGYDNIPIDWNTYFNTVPIPFELEEQVGLYYEICNLQFQVSDICQTAIFYIQSDSLLDTELYRDWLIRIHTPEADYLLAESYYETGNKDECFNIINAIWETYEVYDENENQNYLLYYNLKEMLRTNERTWGELEEGSDEMITLNKIAESGINGAAVKARAIESAFDFLTPCRDDIISKYMLIDLCMYIVNTNNDNFLIPIEDPFEDPKQDNISTSINETTNKEHSLAIYPNPASTLLTIDNGNQMMQKISLCDVLGREIKTFTINASKTDLTITDLSNGFYFLRIQTDKGLVNKRFVKE